jgi:predicted naringenin-chalcone synthase
MSLGLFDIGTAVPKHFISQTDAARRWASLAGVEGKKARIIEALYRRSGVKKRHSSLLEDPDSDSELIHQTLFEPARDADDQGPSTEARMKRFESDAPPLARSAAEAALAESGMMADDITHFVTVSCTGFFAPGLDTTLVDQLGLRPTVERTHVGFMGCHGALNGLRVASAFAGANPEARVLISAVELCTLHMSYDWDPDTLVANSLFGDGSAAVVGVGDAAASPKGLWKLAASGTCRLPDSADAMSWRIGDHGFRMTLSARVPEIIQAHLAPWMEDWLGGQGLKPDQVATWAVHPGGPRILTAAESALDLDPEANAVSTEVLSEFGNMSSATIMFILDRLRRAGAPRPCVALAFGPGLVAEAALFL